MTATEDRMRAAAHALPPSDFGSTRAIQAAADVADAMVAEAEARIKELTAALAPLDSVVQVLGIADTDEVPAEVCAQLINDREALTQEHAEMLAALKAASGYMLNAKIDLETARTQAVARKTIDDGLAIVRAAIAKAEGR